LSPVQNLIAARVVANQHLAERRLDGFDVFGKVLAVFEVELILSTFFRRARGRKTLLGCVAKDRGAKLFVHEDTRFLFGHPGSDSGLEAVIRHLLGSSDLRYLIRRKCALPAEQLFLE
jgi:hypothetical protein